MSHDRDPRYARDQSDIPTTTAGRDEVEAALKSMRPTAALPAADRRVDLADGPTTRSDEHALRAAIAADVAARAQRPRPSPVPGFDVTSTESGPTMRSDERALQAEIRASHRRQTRPTAGPTGFDVTDPDAGPTEAVDQAAFERELRAELARRGEAAPVERTRPTAWGGPIEPTLGAEKASLQHPPASPGPLAASSPAAPGGAAAPLGPSPARGQTDLAGADLAGADLAGADLAGADLAGADLAGAARGLRAHRSSILLMLVVPWALPIAAVFGLTSVAALVMLAMIGLQVRMGVGFWHFGVRMGSRGRGGRLARASAICWGLAAAPVLILAVATALGSVGLDDGAGGLGLTAVLYLAFATPFLSLVGSILALLALATTASELGDESARGRARGAVTWSAVLAVFVFAVPNGAEFLFFGVESLGDVAGRVALIALTGLVLGIVALVRYLGACKAVAGALEARSARAPTT